MTVETGPQRGKRHYQRTLFDSVARLYQDSRPGYPSHIVDFVVDTAGLDAAGSVLEIGCGTGQLTERLARFGFAVTAIRPAAAPGGLACPARH
jgi:2-polyprenyl-3-methyl-5-hydroxy-6-metoxy-1,4-benzoquinol methylase